MVRNSLPGGGKTTNKYLLWFVGTLLLYRLLSVLLFGNPYPVFIITLFISLTVLLVIGGAPKKRSAPPIKAAAAQTRESAWSKTAKPATKPGKIIKWIVLIVTLLELFEAATGAAGAGIAVNIVVTVVVLTLIGLGIGLFAAKMKQSPIERVRGAEDTIREKTKAAAQQAAKRPEIRFLRGGDIEEDDFAMPSSDRCKRRREQLETLYRAGLYTREEYAAEREKLRTRYGSI